MSDPDWTALVVLKAELDALEEKHRCSLGALERKRAAFRQRLLEYVSGIAQGLKLFPETGSDAKPVGGAVAGQQEYVRCDHGEDCHSNANDASRCRCGHPKALHSTEGSPRCGGLGYFEELYRMESGTCACSCKGFFPVIPAMSCEQCASCGHWDAVHDFSQHSQCEAEGCPCSKFERTNRAQPVEDSEF